MSSWEKNGVAAGRMEKKQQLMMAVSGSTEKKTRWKKLEPVDPVIYPLAYPLLFPPSNRSMNGDTF